MSRTERARTLRPTVRVLLTEDVASDAELEVRELKRAGMSVVHRVVESEDAFSAALREFAPDVILSDFSMPAFDGMAALAIAREQSPDTPFIFVSGTIGEEYAIRALKNGATDYVLKSNLVRLPAAVERALADAQARRERRKVETELELVRARLTGIIDSLPDVLWSVALPSEDLLYIGPTARDIFGRDGQEFLTDRDLWINVVHPEDRAAMLVAWRAMLAEGKPFDVEYRVLRPDGAARWVSDRGHIVRDAAGTPMRIDGVARDVTEQVGHRQRIERLSRIRELLGALNAAIVRIRERGALFEEFCRIAVAHGGFVLARVVELGSDGTARVAATTEADSRIYQPLLDDYNRAPQEADSLLALALRTGQPQVANDVAADPRIKNRAALSRDGNCALAQLPFTVEGRVAGSVTLRSREAGVFDQEELGLLAEMVNNISFALELMAKQERISYLALYDPLTGLPNRTLFDEQLAEAIETGRRDKAQLAVIVTDLERFKATNDTLGKQVGDDLLKAVAQRLRQAAGESGRAARVGSNVFVVMFPKIGSAENVARGLEAANVFGAPFDIDGHEIRVTAKTGIAVFPDDGGDAEALFRNAEAALKRAKETGERYLFYAPSINARVAEQVELEHRLRKAVETGELFLHFQPKIDLASGDMVGVEALMRWQGPDGKLVSPARFVPVLEQTGLIFEAGQQVLAAARRQYAAWQAKGLAAPRIAVNVSAVQLRRRSFVQDVRRALGESAKDGGGVDLEVTESLLMTEVDESIRKLRELREMGLRMALDDFGTGYSSLAYLSKLPLDTLKIDRSFVHGMTEHADDTSIVSAIISLAQALRLKVVAEGVETEPQAQLLRLLRCEQVQGFLFSRPLPAEDLEPLLKPL
ncbi:MAG TPA: EAL domain-containing protein [Burkholderiales bacterium]|nr:EAL domain-containing protein [Burkholderiales bacterium]